MKKLITFLSDSFRIRESTSITNCDKIQLIVLCMYLQVAISTTHLTLLPTVWVPHYLRKFFIIITRFKSFSVYKATQFSLLPTKALIKQNNYGLCCLHLIHNLKRRQKIKCYLKKATWNCTELHSLNPVPTRLSWHMLSQW